jgi:hypothetical protein
MALSLAALVNRSAIGHMLQRTFLSMMVHEAGHAVTSWFCGFAAFPALWVTYTSNERSAAAVLMLGAASGYILFRGLRARNRPVVVMAAILLAAQLAGTFVINARTAQALVVFGGDGGAMVLGTALMATFFCGRDTQVYKGWLRWGFLVIGSAAFVDAFGTWWAARTNVDAIPFGANEGVGLSDPSKLMDIYGWSPHTMMQRYITLGMVCLIALAAVWCVGVHRARREYFAATTKAGSGS